MAKGKKYKDSVSEVAALSDSLSSHRAVYASIVEATVSSDQVADPVAMALLDNAWYLHYGDGATTGYWAVTKRPQNTAVAAGVLRRQFTTAGNNNDRVFICIVAGTTANTTDATWTLTRGALIVDGTAHWQECTGVAAFNGDSTNTPNWVALTGNLATAVTLGQVIKDAAGTHVFICSTAGTTAASEPSWDTGAVGNTTVDSGATWTYCGLLSGFSIWNCPHARVGAAVAANWLQAGNTIYVSDASSDILASSISVNLTSTFALCTNLICVKNAPASTPPGSADLSTGALIEANTASAAITVNPTASGRAYVYGVTFKHTSSGSFTFASNNGCLLRMEACSIVLTGNTSTQVMNCGVNGTNVFSSTLELINTTVSLANAAQAWKINSANFIWRKTASAFAGTVPTSAIILQNGGMCDILIEGVDLSSLTGKVIDANTNSAAGYAIIKDCKLNSAVTIASAPLINGLTVDAVRSDSGTQIVRTERHTLGGDLTTSILNLRTGGASDGITPHAWKLVTTASCFWTCGWFEAPVLVRQNRVTSINLNCTVYGVYNAASLPNNDEIWLDVEYMGDSSDTQGKYTSGTKSNVLASGSPLTADTSAWDSAATARANSHAYVLGDIIAVSSAPSQIWFCTVAGTSSGSLPAGYTSVADGTVVVDGTASFRAGMRFSQTVTLSAPQPLQTGPVYGYIRSGKASATYLIDPKLYYT